MKVFNQLSAGNIWPRLSQRLGTSASPGSADGEREPDDTTANPGARRPATGYLVDPSTQTITPWTYNGDWRTIRTAIRTDGSPFTAVYLDNRDCLFVDDEGLLKPVDWFFAIKGYPQPIAGCGLVLGSDGEGETVSASITLDQLKPRILHLRLMSTDPVTFIGWKADDPSDEPEWWRLEEIVEWTEDWSPPPTPPTLVIH